MELHALRSMAGQELETSLSSGLRFNSVQLLSEESLGAGSYGSVCKAKCDDLTCAAKVLGLPHRDKKLAQLLRQECDSLSSLQHPNIVQYLGTWRDPSSSSDLPVLLMELMDESLTRFLESNAILPFHKQVNICHDISLALSFLHSNDILHGNLSSNNVLMIGDRRAKVADFGMTKLWDMSLQKGQSSLIKHPVCEEYMPSEASGSCTSKLDCFSFGVLTIQILTSMFPQPGKPFKVVFISDPNFPNGIETRASEADRRKNHIDLIIPNHPLLLIAMDCIKDKEDDRPSSGDLCKRLATMKESNRYSETSAKSSADILMDDIEKQVMDLQDLSLPSIMSTDATDGENSSTPQREASPLTNGQLEQPETGQIEALQLQISTLQRKEVVTRNEMERLRSELSGKSKEFEDKLSRLDFHKNEGSRLKTKVQELEALLKIKDQVIADMTEANGPMELKRLSLEWKEPTRAPCRLSRTTEAIATSENAVCLRPGGSMSLYSYSIATNTWSKFPDSPVGECGLAIINRKLTVIGGKKGDHFTSRLHSLVETAGKKEWLAIYPPMSTQRCSPIVVQCQKSLVVAGGEGEAGYLNVVEVLDIDNLVWQRAADLPNPLAFASATSIGNHLYILGGWVEKMAPTYANISCPLPSLLQPTQSPTASSETNKSPWHNIADLPLKSASCVSARGRLLAIGGRDIHKPTSAIHAYNPLSNSWEILAYMTHPRHQCFATVLESQLLVLGGWKLNEKQVMVETSVVETALVLP